MTTGTTTRKGSQPQGQRVTKTTAPGAWGTGLAILRKHAMVDSVARSPGRNRSHGVAKHLAPEGAVPVVERESGEGGEREPQHETRAADG